MSIDDMKQPLIQTTQIIACFLLINTSVSAQGLLEDPESGSFQSGIGIIRGWICDAGAIEVQIDDGAKQFVAYGTKRGDTFAVCGDTNNGFGFTFNYGSLLPGSHTLKVFADGIKFGEAAFTSISWGTDFLTGVNATLRIYNFPEGKKTELEWQQSKQNFIARSVTTGVAIGNCTSIQSAITALPATGGQILVPAGYYECTTPVIIDRDNVQLRGDGAGTILRLADNINAPVLIIGQTITPSTTVHKNIHVSDIFIDGNRTNQAMECWGGTCDSGGTTVIRNNGITLRNVTDVVIENVIVARARSGGLVTEKNCRHVTVNNFTTFDNEFDGIAGYQTEDSIFSHLHIYNNAAAGISLDIEFNNNVISDAVLTGNRRLGIFMRNSKDNVLNGIQIRNSGEHGIFIAQDEQAKPAIGNTFTAMTVSNSVQAGLRVNDASCVNNLVVASQFVGNGDGCISEVIPGLVQQCGVICI